MRQFIVVVFLLLLVTFSSVQAQSNCGSGVPCGSLPWKVPRLPALPSPTPIPTISATEVPVFLGTPGSIQPTSTPTAFFDVEQLENQVGTLQAIANSTPISIIAPGVGGTPVPIDEAFTDYSEDVSTVIGFAGGLTSINLGVMQPFITLTLVTLGVVPVVKLLSYFAPIFAALIGIVRKIVQFILQFIPG